MADRDAPFLRAILRGRRREALDIALRLHEDGRAVLDLYAELFQEALYEVGRRWERGEISVAHEHMATAVVQSVMAQLYPRLPLPVARRGRAVIACVQGELHQIGALMIADALEADGWEVQFCGADVPQAAVLSAACGGQVDLLGVSATTVHALPRVVELFGAVRGSGARPPALALGGALARAQPELCVQLGAVPGADDLRESVVRLRSVGRDHGILQAP